MKEFYPLLIIGAIVGVLSLCFVVAYAMMKNKKEAIGFDRNMKDGEIARRLLRYAKPHIGKFLFQGIAFACGGKRFQITHALCIHAGNIFGRILLFLHKYASLLFYRMHLQLHK